MAVKPVAQWTTYQDAKAAVDADLPQDYEICRKMLEEGDYWQAGAGWIGHRTGDAVVDAAMRLRIEPQFVADDVTGELVENRTNGLIGQEADISLDPLEPIDEEADAEEVDAEAGPPTADQEQARQKARQRAEQARAAQQQEIDQVLGALSHWWDQKRLWERVAQASDRVSWARRGAVWPYIADGNLQRTPSASGAAPTMTLPTVDSLEKALDLIDVDAPAPNMATRYVEPSTGRPVAVILTKIGDQERAQVWQVNPTTKKTEVQVFVSGGGTPAGVAADLGERLPFGEMRGRRIVTPSVRQTQALLNFAMTVAGRTLETASARERYIVDAEPELLWLTSEPASTPVIKTHKNEAGNVVMWGVRMPRMVGAGILNEIISLEIPAKDGQPQQTKTASVTALDPVDPQFATNAADAITVRLYKRGKQGHLGLAKSGETSGVAYQQARAQFEADLRRLKSPCEGLIRDVIEGALALAGRMSSKAAAILRKYRVVVNLRISAGPITPEEAQLAVSLRDGGLISQQSAQARVGVEDPAAEQEAIDSDRLAAIDKLLETLRRASGPRSPTLEGYLIFAAAEARDLLPPGMAKVVKEELRDSAQAAKEQAARLKEMLEGGGSGNEDNETPPSDRQEPPAREEAA